MGGECGSCCCFSGSEASALMLVVVVVGSRSLSKVVFGAVLVVGH